MGNLGKEHKNEEYEEYSENIPEINDSIKSKNCKGITEKDVIISLVSKHFSLKLIKEVILSIDTYKQDMIEVGNRKRKLKTNTDVIIVIIYPCKHCWGLIIAYPYFILLKVLFGLKKQKNLLTIFKLDV